MSLNKKNLKQHVARKHQVVTKTITGTYHLKSQCIDKLNGIYVVSKSFYGPSVPVHVVKKIWGSSHTVMCDVDLCNTRVEVAQRSDILVTQCVHLRSADYACDDESEELSESILTEMVEQKWFGEARKKQGLQRQNQAKREGAEFSSLVNIGGPENKMYLSIHEPKLAYYSRLGRILVCYNAKTNTWHCPCSRGRAPCIHKSIAKWHLFQIKREIFQRVSDSEEEARPQNVDSSGQRWQYPPEPEGLKQMVQYIYNGKKLPVTLAETFTEDLKKEDIPRCLIPEEEVCSQCPRNVPLSDPVLISRNAKVATLTGVVNGKCYLLVKLYLLLLYLSLES